MGTYNDFLKRNELSERLQNINKQIAIVSETLYDIDTEDAIYDKVRENYYKLHKQKSKCLDQINKLW